MPRHRPIRAGDADTAGEARSKAERATELQRLWLNDLLRLLRRSARKGIDESGGTLVSNPGYFQKLVLASLDDRTHRSEAP